MGLTIFFWILNALGNVYTTQYEFKIKYYNNPKDLVIVTDLPEKLNLKVSGIGFDLLSCKLSYSSKPLLIDLSQVSVQNNYENDLKRLKINFDDYKNFWFTQLGNQIEVNEIFPKSVDVLLDKKAEKMIEIIPLLQLGFEKQFQIEGKVSVKPAVVNVSGPKSIIDSITQVFTKEIKYEQLDESVTLISEFNDIHQSQKLSFDPNKVLIHIPVEKYTESSIHIPISYKNVPDSIELKAIPGSVEIKFMVPLGKLSTIIPSKFIVSVDYNKMNDRYNKLKVNLEKYPSNLTSLSIKPSKVEYIIKRK
ncbi:MAG: hypothetical protein H6586_01435 [Flavobacteriales bacterium]|nr:hypothetical protein [Flavobacteriales bacterium]